MIVFPCKLWLGRLFISALNLNPITRSFLYLLIFRGRIESSFCKQTMGVVRTVPAISLIASFCIVFWVSLWHDLLLTRMPHNHIPSHEGQGQYIFVPGLFGRHRMSFQGALSWGLSLVPFVVWCHLYEDPRKILPSITFKWEEGGQKICKIYLEKKNKLKHIFFCLNFMQRTDFRQKIF